MTRWLRPPRTLRPTRAGWAFFALTLGVGFAALNTGNNLLYLVLALMLAFLVLSGVLSESALRGIRVERRLPRELFAGLEAPVTLEIGNAQRSVWAYAVVVEDSYVDAQGYERAAGRGFALRVGPGETVQRRYRFVPPQRGELSFVQFRVFTRFPFGLFSKALTLRAPGLALVYPALEHVPVPGGFGAALNAGEGAHAPLGEGPDVAGLREFAPGDRTARVHWPASLRRGGLLVREIESEHEAEVEVRLRTRGPEPGERFERAVGWAASEVVALLASGRRVALATDSEALDAGAGALQRAQLLSFLARVAPDRAGAEREVAA